MMGIMDERAGIMATAIQAEVRGQMERKLNELEAEMKQRFAEAFEQYRSKVLNNIHISMDRDIIGSQTRLNFDIKICDKEMMGGSING